VNDGSPLLEIRGVDITTEGTDAAGIIIGDTSSVGEMRFVSLRRSKTAATGACAIVVENDGETNYFQTPNVTDNVVCSEVGGMGWEKMLCDGSEEYTSPTVPWTDSGAEISGAKTFPWGDADDSNNDGTTDWNLQTQWGGACD
jgi:hypothetical protein